MTPTPYRRQSAPGARSSTPPLRTRSERDQGPLRPRARDAWFSSIPAPNEPTEVAPAQPGACRRPHRRWRIPRGGRAALAALPRCRLMSTVSLGAGSSVPNTRWRLRFAAPQCSRLNQVGELVCLGSRAPWRYKDAHELKKAEAGSARGRVDVSRRTPRTECLRLG